jgi:hypothetical protein
MIIEIFVILEIAKYLSFHFIQLDFLKEITFYY